MVTNHRIPDYSTKYHIAHTTNTVLMQSFLFSDVFLRQIMFSSEPILTNAKIAQ